MSKRSRKQSQLLTLEHHSQPLLSRMEFLKRVLVSFLLAFCLIGLSLFAGMCGYHFIESLSWIDSFENASMILSGMGPVDAMKTFWGKVFAGSYALYSGMVVIAVIGIILGPPLHRMIHRFHADEDGD